MEKEKLIGNMIVWAKNMLGNPKYLGWVPLERVLAQQPD